MTMTYNIDVYNPLRKNIIINEPIDITKLEKIMYNLNDFFNHTSEKLDEEELKATKTMLERIYSNKTESSGLSYYEIPKINRTKYDRKGNITIKGISHGRVFSEVSLMNLRKSMRESLLPESCSDIDIVNCHCVILEHVCKLLNIKCKFLKMYNSNREIVLNQIMKDNNITRKEAKKLPLCIINGAIRSSQYKSEFLKDLEEENKKIFFELMKTQKAKDISIHLIKYCCYFEKGEYYRKYKKIFINGKWIKSRMNLRGSIVNHFLCEIESLCINLAMDFLELNKIDLYLYCYDGLVSSKVNDDFIKKLTQ